MTLSELIYEIGELPGFGPKVQLDFRKFLNRAIAQVAARRNWTFTHDYQQVTIEAASSSASLGSGFKCLGPEDSPVSVNWPDNPSSVGVPVKVITRAQMQRQGWWGYGYNLIIPPALPQAYAPAVFLEQNADGVWTINGFGPYSQPVTYNISAYYYPPALVLGTDSNGVTNNPEIQDALINRAKAIAFLSTGADDPAFEMHQKAGMACQALYEMHYKQAAMDDARRRVAGVSWHW